MCTRYLGDLRTDPVQLQHSRFEEQLFRQRRLEAAEEGEASLRAEIARQERRKRQRADLEFQFEMARLQAEEKVSRPQHKKRHAGSDRRQAMTGGDAPSVARVDSAAATPDRYGFFIKGPLSRDSVRRLGFDYA